MYHLQKPREVPVQGWQGGLGAAARLHPQTSHLGTEVTKQVHGRERWGETYTSLRGNPQRRRLGSRVR